MGLGSSLSACSWIHSPLGSSLSTGLPTAYLPLLQHLCLPSPHFPIPHTSLTWPTWPHWRLPDSQVVLHHFRADASPLHLSKDWMGLRPHDFRKLDKSFLFDVLLKELTDKMNAADVFLVCCVWCFYLIGFLKCVLCEPPWVRKGGIYIWKINNTFMCKIPTENKSRSILVKSLSREAKD